MTKHCQWATGSNMPGYMPDSEPSHFTNWRDARDCFVSDVLRAIEDEDTEENEWHGYEDGHTRYKIEAAACERLTRAKRVREYSLKVGDYVYWLTRV